MSISSLQDQSAHVRRTLLRKIHHYLRDRTLNLKYSSAYALCAVDTEKDVALEVSLLLFFLRFKVVIVELAILSLLLLLAEGSELLLLPGVH